MADVQSILERMRANTQEITASARKAAAQKSQSQPVELPRKKIVIVSLTGACGMGSRYVGRTSVR
jgi:hypothetical protein